MSDPCDGCRHYRPATHGELVGYCNRTNPQTVTWDERTNGECGSEGKHYERAQASLFAETPPTDVQ